MCEQAGGPRRFPFTKERLLQLPRSTNGQRAYYFDTDVKAHGLAIAVTTTGKRNFVLYRRVQGRPKRIQIGPFPDLTIDQARKKAAVFNGEIALGKDPTDDRRKSRDDMTLNELFTQFGELYGQQKKTWPEMQRQFRVYLLPAARGGTCVLSRPRRGAQ